MGVSEKQGSLFGSPCKKAFSISESTKGPGFWKAPMYMYRLRMLGARLPYVDYVLGGCMPGLGLIFGGTPNKLSCSVTPEKSYKPILFGQTGTDRDVQKPRSQNTRH